jgi:hypothetical protein
MTDSLQSYDLELLKRYDAELQEVELLPPAAIELTARQALALVTHMQIAVANPGVKDNPLLYEAIAGAKQIQSAFNPESAIHEMLELGWDSPEDADARGEHPHQILRSVPCRPKMLRGPEPHILDYDDFYEGFIDY